MLVAKKVPEKQRAAVMAAATEKLAQRIRDGQVPKVKVYDKAAPSQRPVVVPTPEMQRIARPGRAGACAVRPRPWKRRPMASRRRPRSTRSAAGASRSDRAALPMPLPTPTPPTSAHAACAWSKASRCTWRACGEGYIVKRMPDTGSHHAPDCPSYEPPAEFSGLGQVLGSAITEDPATGETTLKLDFPLTKMPGRSTMPPAGGESDSVASDGTKLSLRGLLHYLWDQAELTRWHPGFAGKRTWATVRRHLLQAAEHKLARGDALRARLYVPEPFSVDERDAINARRLAQWQHAVAAPGKPQHLMLLIGEVKEIVPARYGFKAVVKHMPDQAFAIDEQLYRRLGRRFEPELALWGASDDIHMVMIATFGVSSAGVPAIHELCLMPVTRQWLPVEDGFEKQLLDRLVGENRSLREGPALQPRPGRPDRERRAHRLRRVGADAVHRAC